MARGEWRGKWMSYKRTFIVICSLNIFIALYVLRSLYVSVYMYPYSDTQRASRYTPQQIRKMEESIQLRKQLEPVELINLVNGLKNKLLMDEKVQQIPENIKEKITDEILVTLKAVNANADVTVLQDVVESWRRKKLKEAAELMHEKTSNSTTSVKEARLLARALGDDWAELSEEIGLWIPVQIINMEHNDKPDGEEELDYEIVAGKQLPVECHAEVHTDYGGDAVRWGLTHHKETAYDCCMACLNQAKHAEPDQKKCNIWVYCPSEMGCHSPDIYQHKHQECWLKYVFVSIVISKYMESKCRKKAAIASKKFTFSPTAGDLFISEKLMQQKEDSEDEDKEEREDFLSVGTRLSRCSSAISYEAFATAKTALSRSSSLNRIEFQDFPRHSVIKEFSHCEGWPFGLSRKLLFLPPLPKSPADSWSWRKSARVIKIH